MALAVTAIAAFAGSASASIGGPFSPGADHVVFVQNNSTTGNQVFAYDRAPNGTLSLAGTYATGGVGGVLAGSVVDHLASQGSLTYDRRHGLLYAVNAGSNSVSVFAVIHDRLYLRQILPSGGSFPVSVAVHNDLVYVLNARNGGSVQGYRVFFNVLHPDRPVEPAARARPDGDARVHEHAGSGRLLAGRRAADRHHEGERQRHRRVRGPASTGGCPRPS